MKRSAIALLITVMFVILITVAIGVALKQVNSASQTLKDEAFLYQSSLILEDVLTILQNSTDLARVGDSNSSAELFVLLSSASLIPFESQGTRVLISLSSARAHYPLASLDANTSQMLREYVSTKGVNSAYVDLLLDCKGKSKRMEAIIAAFLRKILHFTVMPSPRVNI